MKRKKPYIRLTNSEFAMMQLLWEAGRPLNRAEIMEIALRDPENPLFAKNSFHVIINNLIGYQFIAAFINDGPGRKNARRFAPLLTRNEYAGLHNMAINSNRDIESESQVVYVEKQRVFVKDTDNGKQIAEEINDLMNLLEWYNT